MSVNNFKQVFMVQEFAGDRQVLKLNGVKANEDGSFVFSLPAEFDLPQFKFIFVNDFPSLLKVQSNLNQEVQIR